MNFNRLIVIGFIVAATPAAGRDHMQHQHHGRAMQGALGPSPMSREASGTSWQPDAAPMTGVHIMAVDWTVMLHGYVDLIYSNQGGPRGDEKVFVPSMFMAMGQRVLGPGTWGVRSMVSLDPLMGKDGYPLLLQTGETANGIDHLVDRQHPHDFFMELATTYSIPVRGGSVFGYFGLPGEPALGPPAFMHRASGMQIPEAPLTHHWLDSTHITFGVATLGATAGPWKLEGSAFNGREPDQHRWNIETRRLDSWSGRVTFNPAPQWSAQISHGYLKSPEQLDPDVSVRRTTASISHTRALQGGHWSTTLAAGINREHGESEPGYALESIHQFGQTFSLFGRAEYLHNDHLLEAGPLAGNQFHVGKLSLGGSRRLVSARRLAFDAGVLGSAYLMPNALEAEYGSNPLSFMVFVRTSIK
jgi:hypothetical protein